jgi:hypothetical protein
MAGAQQGHSALPARDEEHERRALTPLPLTHIVAVNRQSIIEQV